MFSPGFLNISGAKMLQASFKFGPQKGLRQLSSATGGPKKFGLVNVKSENRSNKTKISLSDRVDKLNSSFLKSTKASSNIGAFLEESLFEMYKINQNGRAQIQWKTFEAILSDTIDDQSEIELETLTKLPFHSRFLSNSFLNELAYHIEVRLQRFELRPDKL